MTFEEICKREREAGREEGREELLCVLVNTLKEFVSEPEMILERIKGKPGFEEVTLEKICECLNKDKIE